MGFQLLKLARSREPEIINHTSMPMDEIAVGLLVKLDSTDWTAAVAGATTTPAGPSHLILSDGNDTIYSGGGINFPLATATDSAVYPLAQRLEEDALYVASVSGTAAIATVIKGTNLKMNSTGDGLVLDGTSANNVDFLVEEALENDGTNVTKVSGYILSQELL